MGLGGDFRAVPAFSTRSTTNTSRKSAESGRVRVRGMSRGVDCGGKGGGDHHPSYLQDSRVCPEVAAII